MGEATSEKSAGTPMPGTDELTQLRTLMLEPEQGEIGEIKKRLNDPKIRSEELSNILAEAIVLRAAKDNKLAIALLPTIDAVLRDTVKKDPKFLADTLFPVIGPAIRKAIAESLRSMMQSLSTTLDYTFSWRGIKWRMESIRTGRPFAEIILLHTLIYRVEQIFLIHKETGLVLQHVAADNVDVKDAGMVSAMLTAIQDFVNDSFSGQEDAALDNLNLGEITVWIEQGPRAVLAAVIRGSPPKELRGQLKEIIENIEFEYGMAMDAFKGDASQFDSCKPSLDYFIAQAQQTGIKAKKSHNAVPITSKKRAVSKHDSQLIYLYVAGGICLLILLLGFIFSVI